MDIQHYLECKIREDMYTNYMSFDEVNEEVERRMCIILDKIYDTFGDEHDKN